MQKSIQKNDSRTATWISHSSIRTYLSCPRAYYLTSVYKNPKTGNRMGLVQPALSLGQAVHDVLESLSQLPAAERMGQSLVERFERAWQKVSGQKGGFDNESQELEYKKRGEEMIARVQKNPGILAKKAVKLKTDGFIPHYWLSEEENIILCGKIDWLEYLEETDSVHIVDFKTGKNEEDGKSLQLPIYLLLTANCQKRNATKASYWYLDKSDGLSEVSLPKIDEAIDQVLKVAKKIKLARELKTFKCPKGESGCMICRPFETVYRDEALFVGTSDARQDMYFVKNQKNKAIKENKGDNSVIL